MVTPKAEPGPYAHGRPLGHDFKYHLIDGVPTLDSEEEEEEE